MDTPKLQPITNKIKHNSSNANNNPQANEGSAGDNYEGNARFNNNGGGGGNGPSGNINNGPNQAYGSDDRRFNYCGPPHRDFIPGPRNKFQNRSDTFHYYGNQWNQNRFNNGPNNRNNNNNWSNDYNDWSNDYNDWSNDYNCNGFGPNPNFWQNEPARRRDNSCSPYFNELERRPFNAPKKNNTPTTARTNSTDISAGRNKEKSGNLKQTENINTTYKPKTTVVRSSPRKKPLKVNPVKSKEKTGNKIKVTPKRAYKKILPKGVSENATDKTITNCDLNEDKSEKIETEKSETGSNKCVAKSKEQNLTSEKFIKFKENKTSWNFKKITEQNKSRANCSKQIHKQPERVNSTSITPGVCPELRDSKKAKESFHTNSNKESEKIVAAVEKSANSSDISKEKNNDLKTNITEESRNLAQDDKNSSDNNLQADESLSNTNSNSITKPIKIEDKTNQLDEDRGKETAFDAKTAPENKNTLLNADLHSIVIPSDNEDITETVTIVIPSVDIELSVLDISEDREAVDEEIASLQCKVSPVKILNDKPKISIIPLSRLVRNELIELADDSSVTEIEDAPTVTLPTITPSKRICRPNLVKRRRKISTCSNSSGTTENLIEKVAGMDKFGIQQVINNSGTRFDEALKAQARKRLREEIRKQLKSMSLETAKNAEDVNFVPDDIVDAICIPDVVLEEIRKAFGVEIFCNKNTATAEMFQNTALSMITPNMQEKTDYVNVIPNEESVQATVVPPPLQESLVETSSTTVLPTPDSIDNNREKVSENNTTKENSTEVVEPDKGEEPSTEQVNPTAIETDKASAVKEEKKTDKIRVKRRKKSSWQKSSRKKTNKDVILIKSSSSSSCSSSSSSSSSSDTESEASAKSASSSVKRRRLKLRVDAQNIVESFEKLILPSLSENLKYRYHNKFSNSTYTRLHFIACICTSEYNTKKFTKPEIAKIQANLKSEDRSVALEFLMREIVNVFNKQKEAAKKERGSNRARKSTEGQSGEATTITQDTQQNGDDAVGTFDANNSANRIALQGVNGSSSSSSTSSSNKKNVDAAEKVNAKKNCAQSRPTSTGTPTPTKHQHQSVNGQTLMGKKAADGGGDGDRAKSADSAERANDVVDERHKTGVDETSAAVNNSDEINNLTNQVDSNGIMSTSVETHQLSAGETSNEDNETSFEQVRGTAYENTNATTQTFLNNSSNSINLQSPTNCRLTSRDSIFERKFGVGGASNPLVGFENNTNGFCGISNMSSLMSSTLFPNVDLEALRQKNILGEFVVNNLRDFDAKLMELHKRKMFIEEMILKLQKDKMEVDIHTMHLQNEKFMLLNTAMTAAANDLPDASASTSTRTSSLSPNTLTQIFRPTQVQTPTSTGPSLNTILHGTQTGSSVREKRKAINDTVPNIKRKRKRGGVRFQARKANLKNIQLQSSNIVTTQSVSISSNKNSARATVTAAREYTPPSTMISDMEQACSDAEQPFDCADLPISCINVKSILTQVHLYEHWLVATGEDGRLYQFNARTLKLEKEITKHNEAITHSYLCREKKMLFTTSHDGYMKKTSLENFGLDIQSVYMQEPLQCIECQWGSAFVGSRWGNVFTYDIMSNNLINSTISASDVTITAIKATKEGTRRILIVASKSKEIQIRDASSGLLLRTLTLPEPLKAYSLLLDDGCVYCSTQRRDILKIDFTTGQHLTPIYCGSGAVTMRLYQSQFMLVGSYDGFVYVLDKMKERHCGRYAGCAGNILSLTVASNKIILTSKDRTLRVIELPQSLSAKRK